MGDSHSDASSCSPGWRDDNFLLFTPIRCGLFQPIHFILICIWFSFHVVTLMEMLLNLWTKNITLTPVGSIASCLHAAGNMGAFIIVFINPYVSVLDTQENLAFYVLLSIGAGGAMFLQADVADLFARTNARAVFMSAKTVNGFQYTTLMSVSMRFVLPIISCATIITGFCVLPAVLPEAQQKQNSVRAALAIYGFLLIVMGMFSSYLVWRIRRVAVNQAVFHRRMSITINGPNTNEMNSLNELIRRSGMVSIQIILNASISGAFLATAGGVLGFPYWLFHFIVGPTIIFFMVRNWMLFGSPTIKFIRMHSNATAPAATDTTSDQSRRPSFIIVSE